MTDRTSYPPDGIIPWRTLLLIGTALALLVGLMAYGYAVGDRLQLIHSPLLGTIVEIRKEAADCRQAIETIAADGVADDSAEVLKPLDQAVWHFFKMLEMSRQSVESAAVQDEAVQDLARAFDRFRSVAAQRMAGTPAAEVISGPKGETAAAYETFLSELNRVEGAINELHAADRWRFRAVMAVLTGFCAVLAIAVGLAVRRYEKRKMEQLAALKTAHDDLRREIESRSRTEHALEKSERLLRTVFNASSEAIIITQVADGRVVEVNQGFTDLTGFTATEVIGRSLTELAVWHRAEQRQWLVDALERQGKVRNWEAEFRRKDGRVRIGLLSAALIRLDDEYHILGVARDVTEIKQAEIELKRSRDELEERVRRRTEQLDRYNRELLHEIEVRKRAERELIDHQQRLRSLTSQLLQTEERERRELAAEIHDRIGHALAAAKIKLGGLQKALADREFATVVAEIRAMLTETIRDTRTLTFELSPPVLYELGLPAALEWLAGDIRTRHGLPVEVRCDDAGNQLEIELRVLIFRMVRELLFNVVKHAAASHARVHLRDLGQNRLEVEVVDDGYGFSGPASAQGEAGFGLFSIQEQLKHCDGSLEIRSEPGTQTRVTIHIRVPSVKDKRGEDVRELSNSSG
jgi:PAS domain S-box-containing protein